MKIKFLKTQLEVECKEEEIPLIEVCYNNKTPVNFGCRIGMCGTCRVKIVAGIENVSEKNEDEEYLTHCSNERLACQCIVRGDIEIE